MTAARTIGVFLSGITMLITADAVAGEQRRCGEAPVGCLPTLEEHGPIAAAPLPRSGHGVAAPTFAELGPSRDLAPSAPVIAGGHDEELPAFDPSDLSFTSSLEARVASLGSCRVDIARMRGIRPSQLPEETVRLRLWVTRDGRVRDSLVSVPGAMGAELADCVKRQVRDWSLMPPQGDKGAFVDINVKISASGKPALWPAEPAW